MANDVRVIYIKPRYIGMHESKKASASYFERLKKPRKRLNYFFSWIPLRYFRRSNRICIGGTVWSAGTIAFHIVLINPFNSLILLNTAHGSILSILCKHDYFRCFIDMRTRAGLIYAQVISIVQILLFSAITLSYGAIFIKMRQTDQVDRRERRSIQELRQDDDHLRRRLHLPMVVVDTGQHLVNGQSSTGCSVYSARCRHQPWRGVQLHRIYCYTLPIQTVGIDNSGW